MNILLTIHHELEQDSGAPGSVLSIAEAMRSLGHTVDILSYEDLKLWARGRASLFLFPLLVVIRAIAGRGRYDVLDFASTDGIFIPIIPRWLLPPVVSLRSHGLEHIEDIRLKEGLQREGKRPRLRYRLLRGGLILRLLAIAARRADACFFLNKMERQHAIDTLGVAAQKSFVVPHGLPEYLIDVKAVPCVNSIEPVKIAFVGTYLPRKGIEYLKPALVKWLASDRRRTVSFLGTIVPREQVLSDLPPEIRDQAMVIPTFDRRRLPELLSGNSIFVLPSLSEGFGKAALEAMACGLVPIVTRGHGFDEFVENGVNGLLIDRADSTAIVDAIEYLDQDRSVWLKMSTAALCTAKSFTWERSARSRLVVYARGIPR